MESQTTGGWAPATRCAAPHRRGAARPSIPARQTPPPSLATAWKPTGCGAASSLASLARRRGVSRRRAGSSARAFRA
eukprot:2445826-Prymnesium_polylepis.1